MFNYRLETFIEHPKEGENLLRITNILGQLKYTIFPKLCYFFSKNNLIIIKTEDEKEIVLDFENPDTANRALSKLNIIKYDYINSTSYVTVEYLNKVLSSVTSGETGTTYYAGSGITIDSNHNISINVDNRTMKINNSGKTQSNVLFIDTFNVLSAVTNKNIGSTGLHISYTPVSNIDVLINGVSYDVTNTMAGPFFFGKNYYTPISINNVNAGDELFFNGLTANINLSLTDEIKIIYNTIIDVISTQDSGLTMLVPYSFFNAYTGTTSTEINNINNDLTNLSSETWYAINHISVSGYTLSSDTYTLSSETWNIINNKSNINLNINQQSTNSYTLNLSDNGKLITLNSTSTINVYIPANSAVPFPIGAQILINNSGSGQVVFVANPNVVINSADDRTKLRVQNSNATLIHALTDVWILSGDITS